MTDSGTYRDRVVTSLRTEALTAAGYAAAVISARKFSTDEH